MKLKHNGNGVGSGAPLTEEESKPMHGHRPRKSANEGEFDQDQTPANPTHGHKAVKKSDPEDFHQVNP